MGVLYKAQFKTHHFWHISQLTLGDDGCKQYYCLKIIVHQLRILTFRRLISRAMLISLIAVSVVNILLSNMHAAFAFRQLRSSHLATSVRPNAWFSNYGKRFARFVTIAEKTPEADASKSLLAVHLPTNEDSPNLLRIRHSAAHIMAMAVQTIFPKIKVTIGPWIENG